MPAYRHKPGMPVLNRRHCLANNLTAFWSLGDTSGDFRDSVQGNHASQIDGAVTRTRGPFGSSPSLASDRRIATPNSPALSISSRPFSLGIVFRAQTHGGGGYNILVNGGAGSSNKIYFYLDAGTANLVSDGMNSVTLSLGAIWPVVYSYTPSKASPDTSGTETFHCFGDDGTYKTATRTGAVSASSANSTLTFGGRAGTFDSFFAFNGDIFCAALWSGRALSRDEAAVWAVDPFSVVRQLPVSLSLLHASLPPIPRVSKPLFVSRPMAANDPFFS